MKCTSSMQPAKFNIISYQHPSVIHNSKLVMPMSQPLLDTNTKYIPFFFDLVRSSGSPMIQIFSFASIGKLLHTNELVQDTVNLVGKAYVSQGSYDTTSWEPASQRKYDSRKSLARLRVNMLKLLRSPASTAQDSTASLVAACLLQFVELLLYDSGSTWGSLVYQVLSTVSPKDKPGCEDGGDDFFSSLNRRLRLFLRTSGGLWAICYDHDCFWTTSERNPPEKLLPEPDLSLIELDNVDRRWDDLAGCLEDCGKLLYKLVLWIKDSLNAPGDAIDSSVHRLNGIELVVTATHIQQRIISTIVLYSTSCSEDHFCRFLLPYYYWLLASLSHIFTHLSWRTLAIPLPVMTQSLARQQAARAFEYVESNIHSFKLEAVAYAPILHIIAHQFSADNVERDRVLAVVESIRLSGYSVAGGLEKELQFHWAEMETKFFCSDLYL
ncbi:hypothetical protein TMatcc_006552 [Talaromyces marneffei ATCC 18224]